MSKRPLQYILLTLLCIGLVYLFSGATDEQDVDTVDKEITMTAMKEVIADRTIDKKQFRTELQRVMNSLKNDPGYSDLSVSFFQGSITQVVAMSAVEKANEMGSVSCSGSGYTFTECCVRLFESTATRRLVISYYRGTDTFWAQDRSSGMGDGC